MRRGIFYALAAAALFGASTPFAKLLLADVHPVVLAAFLYAGSGLGLAVVQALRLALGRGRARAIAWPPPHDWAWLSAAIFAGGIVAPVLLLLGLATTAASTASLLLTLESAFTAVLAWFVFGENFDRRIVAGMAAIVSGAVILVIEPGSLRGLSPGALLIGGACVGWAIDNNLTRKVSGSDAITLAGLKGLVAAAVNVTLALALRLEFPHAGSFVAAGATGFLGYGLSLVLFVLALRHLGASRTGAYFAVAPFFGGLLAFLLLGDAPTVRVGVAGTLMAFGVWLHLREHHEHMHRHEPIEHTHVHRHDAHHRHRHDFPWDGREPHTHRHHHEPLVHEHVHYPDLHHRHEHPK
ncbi:MAG TPA: DMT family transporter [Acidimicrobiia bacterium]|jgi:drug/metabolite transporter (DMT)-like permease|nr:DMT family transporter [Acidimicrobiia bacterium]